MILIPILIYILIILVLFIYKPSIIFKKSNDNNKSLFSLENIYPFIAIFCYYIYLLLLIIIKE